MQADHSDASITSDREPLLIDLALQGGGAHGAYTWGVLDRLLEESWLRIDGISGTSAGAMNAAALVYGHSLDGNDGARRALKRFWRRVSQPARHVRSRANSPSICRGTEPKSCPKGQYRRLQSNDNLGRRRHIDATSRAKPCMLQDRTLRRRQRTGRP
jgi:predicted acylesterase/phospholipase RssA